MLDDTWPQYLFIRVVILILQYIGPGCLLFTAWRIFHNWPERPSLTFFQIWAGAEALWFLALLGYREYLQREAVHPPLRSPADRRALFNKVCSEIHNPEKFLSGWFRGAKVEEIGREELKLFLGWAFWEGRTNEKDAAELEEYTQKVERMMRREFAPGYGTAMSLRLTIDPIIIECRTILWYTLIGLADFATHVLMRKQFQYFKTIKTSLQVLPLRPATWVETQRSPTKDISYWLRPHTSKSRLPILYIHGIGVGLLPCVKFMAELTAALDSNNEVDGEGQVGILAIEILQVSSRLTAAIPHRDEFLSQITAILDHHGFNRFVLCSHSYGSTLSTHILTHDPLSSRIAATLLVDPVSILLHMPDVAYNFTVRPPKHANEWELWYFASKDPEIAHTLGRHFFWSENVLWRDRIMALAERGMRITASLASEDLIVDTGPVGEYLMENTIPDPVLKSRDGREEMELETKRNVQGGGDWKTRRWRGEHVEVLWWARFDHAQVFDKKESRSELIKVLSEYVRGR